MAPKMESPRRVGRISTKAFERGKTLPGPMKDRPRVATAGILPAILKNNWQPPLRDRKQDIDLLCEHFLEKYAPSGGKAHMLLTDRIREQFYRYSWPGNVREQENVIQAIASLGNEESFYQKISQHGLSGLCPCRKEPTSTADALKGSMSQLLARYTLKDLSKKAARKAETDAILDVLTYAHWNRRKAAALLKTSYRTLLSNIKEYEIQLQPNGLAKFTSLPCLASAISRKPKRAPKRQFLLDMDKRDFEENRVAV